MGLHALTSGYMLSEYKIQKLLGEGGFGLTYLAFDTLLEKKVAIKEYMPSEHAIRQDDSHIIPKSEKSEKVYKWGLNAFLNEAKILAKFEDSNIVRVHRFFKAHGTAYIVMEYCEGGCLIDRISKDKSMDEEELKDIMSSIVHGLQMVHNDGILHRDIKPDNIMFRQNGTPVLIDFGAAREAIGQKSRKVTTIITPGFAPLEQYSSKGVIGPWSDIYSLSAVAYTCLTGKRPPDIMNRLHDDTITKLSSKFPTSAFIKSIDAGLCLQVDDRPKSLSEWSSQWSNYSIPVSTEFELNNPYERIIASRSNTDNNNTLQTPISARSSLNPHEQTIVNTSDINVSPLKKEKSSFGKVLLSLIFISILAGGGYFGYEYKKQQDKQAKIVAEQKEQIRLAEIKRKEERKELVLKIQRTLNKLGYTITENGEIDSRTTESIKDFENKNDLIVTGKLDEIILKELNTEFTIIDDIEWKKANKDNTQESYQEYLFKFPKGAYASQVPIIIENLQNNISKQEHQPILTELDNSNQSARLQQIKIEKKRLITSIQIELKRLKFHDITATGDLDFYTTNSIKAFQKLKNIDQNGLPTKTLLFLLKSEQKWPGRIVGEVFSECSECPDMVVIKSGNFNMGSNKGKSNELPLHNVIVDEFIISKTEVTFSQWDKCFDDGFCTHRPDDEKLGRGSFAVMKVNWYDTQQFIKWLNNQSEKNYRLPTEAEWEYAARAGTKTEYFWGDEIGKNHANCIGCNSEADNSQINLTKNYPANAFGLYDMSGNVWEWTADCWHPNYMGAPSSAVAWEPVGCTKFVVRGGSGGNKPEDLRSASRGVMNADKRLNSLGFRVALDSN